MRKLRTLLYVFRRSVFDPAYYSDIPQVKLKFSLKYLYFLLFLLSFVTAVKLAAGLITIMPKVEPTVKKLKVALKKDYPADLVITIKNGQVATNAQEPVSLNFSNTARVFGGDGKTNFITIDTNGKVEDYPSYKTIVLVTKKAIVSPENSSSRGKSTSYTVSPLQSDFNFQISKPVYDEILNRIYPIMDKLPVIVTVLAVLSLTLYPLYAAWLWMLGKMIYLLPMSLVMLILAKIMKKGLSYGNIYQMGLHAVTVPTLNLFVLEMLGYKLELLYTGIFGLWMVVILAMYKKPAPTKAASTSSTQLSA